MPELGIGDSMKIVGIVAGGYFAYIQLRDALDFWLPAVGVAAENGFFWVQFAILAVLAAAIFTSIVSIAYRFLSELLD
jgi:hypothetical protein